MTTVRNIEEHKFRRKYGARLAELGRQLDALEARENFEELTVGDIPVLEAVSDTRRWEHLLEHLDQEEERLRQLEILARL